MRCCFLSIYEIEKVEESFQRPDACFSFVCASDIGYTGSIRTQEWASDHYSIKGMERDTYKSGSNSNDTLRSLRSGNPSKEVSIVLFNGDESIASAEWYNFGYVVGSDLACSLPSWVRCGSGIDQSHATLLCECYRSAFRPCHSKWNPVLERRTDALFCLCVSQEDDCGWHFLSNHWGAQA